MSKLIVAVGLPASGKSTYSESLKDENIIVLSSDLIRKEVFGNEKDQEHNEEVFQLMFQKTVSFLRNNTNVFYDATNIYAKDRIELIKKIKEKVPNTYFECVWFNIPFNICLRRNKKRERVVPFYAMKRMYNNFENPQMDEGWDNIKIITRQEQGDKK